MKESAKRLNLLSVFKKCCRVAPIITILLVSAQVFGQVDCTTTMACNDLVQVSLDENCEAVIAPDMILEDPAYDNSHYAVIIRMENGDIVPSETVTAEHIGMTLETQVIIPVCGISCWGFITVEDKLPPVITSCEDYIVNCNDDITPGEGVVPLPTVEEACGTVETLVHFDEITNNSCADQYVQVVERRWTVIDDSGNETSCTQTISVVRANISTIGFPDDLTGHNSLDCEDMFDLTNEGTPSPSVTGYPTGVECPNIQVYFDDVVFNTCGATQKILRQWLVLDWCTGLDATHNQTIKIVDDVAPVCDESVDNIETVSTDEGQCTKKYEVPIPPVMFDCSDYDYSITYQKKDHLGAYLSPSTYLVTRDAQDIYYIDSLPQDTTIIHYTITDACSNVSECTARVVVVDNEAPTPVCEGYTVISLEDLGSADLFATSINDGSYDNCEIDRYEVRRESTPCGNSEDLEYGNKVNFCCEDVSSEPVMVYMRVYDVNGNFNDCIVNVTVQDKIHPLITCPPDNEFDCNVDIKDLDVTGRPIVTDNCTVEVDYEDNEDGLNDCGLGTIVRTWTAVDGQGLKSSCNQNIEIRDMTPFNEDNIEWPADLAINGCNASNITPDALNSFPTTNNDDCANIAMSHFDDVFYNAPDVCVKILRRWRVTDDCNFDPQNPIFYEHIQKITVVNSEKPDIVSDCSDKIFDVEDGSCEIEISESITATDDCTPAALLKYSYTIDLNSNGTIDISNDGRIINSTFSGGVHTITWTVVDACGNTEICSYTITVRDDKAPTPICHGEVIWVLDEDGHAEVWASDFNFKSEDSCDDEDDLIFAFSSTGSPQVLEFTCDDVPNGIAETIDIDMYVIDTDGNYEYCTVKLLLQDSELTDACDDMEDAKGAITGMITTNTSVGITDIEVELVDVSDQEYDHEMTQVGEYGFDDIDHYNEYVVTPSKNDDVRNGVNTLDLVKIQRHILELEIMEDPYALIAADINNDERLTPADLLSLRKVILGLDTQFPENESWRFIPKTYQFENQTEPFDFPEEIVVGAFYNNLESADFTAIKVGDVDNSVIIEDNGLVANPNISSMAAIAPEFEVGETVTVEFRAYQLKELIGMQMTLGFDYNALIFREFNSGVLTMTDINIAVAEQGKLAVSWNDVNAISLNSDDVLFTLSFQAQRSGHISEYLSMESSITEAQVYDNGLNTSNLILAVVDHEQEVIEIKENKLYQNVPNPFENNTTIKFEMENSGRASLKIYDITGKMIVTQTGMFKSGQNQFDISFEGAHSINGVLYYTLETENFQATRKMVIVR